MKEQIWPFLIIIVGLVIIGCSCVITDIFKDIAKNKKLGI